MPKESLFEKGSVFHIYYQTMHEEFESEIDYLRDVLRGHAKVKDQDVSRFLKAASAGSKLVPLVGTYLSGLTSLVDNYLANQHGRQVRGQAKDLWTTLRTLSPKLRTLRLKHIAMQATYRWCYWLNAMNKMHAPEQSIIDFAQLGVTRMMTYILAKPRECDLSDTESVILGLIKGGRGVKEFASHVLHKNSQGVTFTVEGAYQRMGIMTPLRSTTGHRTFYRMKETKEEKDSTEKYGWIQATPDLFAQLEPKYPQLAPNARDELFPVIYKGDPQTLPKDDKKREMFALPFCYVTLEEIAEYLTTVADYPDTFNGWFAKKLQNIGIQVANVHAVLIGSSNAIIDGENLAFKEFHRGDFSETDFSGVTFKNLELGKFKNAFLRFCKFIKVRATGDVLVNADISASEISQSDWSGLIFYQLGIGYCKFVSSVLRDVKNPEALSAPHDDDVAPELDADTLQTFAEDKRAEYIEKFGNQEALERRLQDEFNKHFDDHAAKWLEQEKHNKKTVERFDEGDLRWKEVQNTRALERSEKTQKEKEANEERMRERAERAAKDLELEKRFKVFEDQLRSGKKGYGGGEGEGDTTSMVEEKELMTQEEVAELSDTISIDYSGQNGFAGDHGAVFGQPGRDGTNGEDAHKISRTIEVNERTGVVVVANRNVEYGQEEYLRLGDAKSRLIMKANGGHGGAGGNGYAGKDGRHGMDGANATQSRAGGDGTNGEAGTAGGNGGKGGDGGSGATIEITVPNPRDTDALLYIVQEELSCGFGDGGKSGRGGKGGAGGRGGHGGASHTWQESSYYTDAQGNARTRYISHSNPGGRDGQPGADGYDGQDGPAGRAGRPGRVRWSVGRGGKAYDKIFDVDIYRQLPPKVLADDDVPHDIFIEPGQKGLIQNIILENKSDMPTPYGMMAIAIDTAASDSCLVFDPASAITIRSGFTNQKPYLVAEKLPFQIAAQKYRIPQNRRLQQKVQIRYDIRMQRVQKSFPLAKTFTSEVLVQYPLVISNVAQSSQLITPDGQLVFSAFIFNSSLKEFGVDTYNRRSVHVTMQKQTDAVNEALSFVPLEAKEEPFVLTDDLRLSVRRLASGQATVFPGTLQIDPRKVQGNERYQFTVKLWLEQPDTDTEGASGAGNAIAIQTMAFNLRLALPYRPDPNADFVLVVNEATKQNLIQSWGVFANRLGKSIAVWNSTLYDGYGYEQARVADNQSFYKELPGKVVVVFDNPAKHNYEPKEVRVLDEVDPQEIYTAARYANIRTYVVTDTATRFHLLDNVAAAPFIEAKRLVQKSTTRTSEKDMYFFPDPKALMSEAKIDNELRQQPLAPWYAYTGFNPALLVEEKQGSLDIYKPLALLTDEQVCCTCAGKNEPDGRKLEAVGEELAQKTLEKFPERVYTPVAVHETEELAAGCCITKFSVGRLELRRGINANEAKIGVHHSQNLASFHEIQMVDQFNILKLLPIQKKIELLPRVLGDQALSQLLMQVLLSDVTEELALYANIKKSPDKIRDRLVYINQLTNVDSAIKGTQQGAAFMSEFLARLELIVMKKDPKTKATKAAEKIVKGLKKKYLDDSKVSEQQYEQRRVQLKDGFKARNNTERSERIWQAHARPFEGGVGGFFATRFNTDPEQLRSARRVKSFGVRDADVAHPPVKRSYSFRENTCAFWRYGSAEQAAAERLAALPAPNSVQPNPYPTQTDRLAGCINDCDINSVVPITLDELVEGRSSANVR